VDFLVDIYGFLSVVLHGLLLTAQAFTLGGIAFLLLLAAPMAGELGERGDLMHQRSVRLLRWSAIASAIVAAVTLGTQVPLLMDTLDQSLGQSLTASFAVAGIVEIVSSVAIVLLAGRSRVSRLALLIAALVLLAAAVATTHAMARTDERTLPALLTALHRVASAAWIGGIPYFLVGLTTCRHAWREIGARFSRIAMISVAFLAASGIGLSIVYIGSIEALYGTSYGVMVSVKVALFLGLLFLGGMNFLTVRRLKRDPTVPAKRLLRFAEAEIGIGISIFFCAASLTSLPPAVDLTQDRVSLAEYAAALAPRWPSLESPDTSSLAIPALQAKLDAEAAARQAKPQPAYVPGAGLPPPRNAANIAWSEYNHHWAGILVVIVALLALAERTGYAPWARHWPLLFVLLAVFLEYRDEREIGLHSNMSLLDSFRDPEVVQHRVLYFLVALFGLFEWAVRTGRLKHRLAPLAFPILTAIGASLLLTHSHVLANVKELLLIEITHMPMALFGITAAWARWLELRLDPPESRIAGWVWPFCFMMVGVLLLAYREA
jgi:putative copper resistance protein D